MMKVQSTFARAGIMFLIFTLICGIGYTGVVTLMSQLLFPYQANGSMITVNGITYGSELLGQQYTRADHLWGRQVELDTTTYKDSNGNALLYSKPSNLSPASSEYQKLIAERVAAIKAANPDAAGSVPVDLVTGSGSGLDPDISPAAADYQVPRIAKASGLSEDQIRTFIARCTSSKFLGIFGEQRVNVLKVNLLIENAEKAS